MCPLQMDKRVLSAVLLTLFILLVFALPAVAQVYNYTATGFRYIGDVFHEKEIDVPGGGINSQVSGKGEVSGSHFVGSSTAAAVYGVQPRTKVHMTANFYGTTAMDAADDEHMRIITEMSLRDAKLQTGVEMDPGESGYIRQSAYSSSSPDGRYLKTSNYFGNTGGTTRRVNEVSGFMTDRMEVVGYAYVYETTRLRSGTERTGFWDIN